MKSRYRSLLGTAAAVALLVAANASAEEVSLTFATTTAANSPASAQLHHPWAERINAEGKGIIRIDVRDGPAIANAINAYSRVMDDVIQLAPISPSYVGGKFPLLEVVNLPMISDKSCEASMAFWRLYKSGVLDANFQDSVPLHVVAFPHAGLHLRKAPSASLDDLSGLKLQSGGKVLSDTISRLGGTPLSLTVVDLYQALQRGTVDGTVIMYMTFPTFKFDEVTSYHLDFPFSSWPQMVFMTKKRYDGLSPDARRIIEKHSSEAQSRRWGAFYDDLDTKSRQMIADSKQHTIVTPTSEQSEKWRQKVIPVIEAWVKSTPGGDKVLTAYRAELKKAKCG